MGRSLAPPLIAFVLVSLPLRAEAPPLLPVPAAAALAEELSGELAKRNLELIARQHRMRGSRGYAEAAQFVAGELRRYGLSEVEVVAIPADGETFYGTQRSRRPWDADFGELWELRREQPERAAADSPAKWTRARRLASWDAVPLSLAQDSESGDVEADLVDVGAGTTAADYAGREVRGRLVLTSSQPEAVVPLAIERFGAAGIVSYAQNQRTAWWGDDATLVRWGHVGSFNRVPAFAFMVSLATARDFQARLLRGETVRLHAVVRAGQHRGAYQVVTAVIPGADPVRRGEELTFSCHLDHPRPGANDNASGCATILEVARSVSKLLADGRLPRPARTLRFVFPPEIEGTLALLHHRPEIAARARAAIHLDMVGGGPATKAVFHVTRGPASLPSFVHDVAAALGAWANRETRRLRRARPRRVAAGRRRGRQGAAAGGALRLHRGQRPRRLERRLVSASRRSTSTTGPTATSTPPATPPPTSTPPSSSARPSSPPPRRWCSPISTLDRAAAVEPLLRAASLRRLATLVERRAGLPADGEGGGAGPLLELARARGARLAGAFRRRRRRRAGGLQRR